MRRIVPFLICLTLLASSFWPGSAAPVRAQAASCQFVLGFLALQQMIPNIVGPCLDNVSYDAEGNGVQHTIAHTGALGLLVWRKSDNFTAFTDGFRTWVNGPFGLQTRLNSQRFFWEFNPERLPIIPTPVAGDRCHTAQLSLSVDSMEGAAGSIFATFRFTNNAPTSCTFFGFPGAQQLDQFNSPLPTNVVRGGGQLSNQPGPSLVTVPGGGSAIFVMQWGQVPVGNETTCPVASRLLVTPPDEVASIIFPIQIMACGGGTLNVSAIRPAS